LHYTTIELISEAGKGDDDVGIKAIDTTNETPRCFLRSAVSLIFYRMVELKKVFCTLNVVIMCVTERDNIKSFNSAKFLRQINSLVSGITGMCICKIEKYIFSVPQFQQY
jgi:hypothetical protein